MLVTISHSVAGEINFFYYKKKKKAGEISLYYVLIIHVRDKFKSHMKMVWWVTRWKVYSTLLGHFFDNNIFSTYSSLKNISKLPRTFSIPNTSQTTI